MSRCPLEVKCPAYHIVPGLGENRKIGSPIHLLPLLGLNRHVIESYDVRNIREKIQDPDSAQQIYLLLQKKIQQMTQSERKKFEDPAARKLLRESDKVPAMRDKTLRYKASMIVKLVQQLRYAFLSDLGNIADSYRIQPYKELWRQFHRQQRFGPTARD